MSLIVIIAVAIIAGLLVFLVSSALINKGKKEEAPFTGEPVDLNDQNVQILYKYVTYGTKGTRNQKFVSKDKVTLADFSDEEKLYYAFQFVQAEDFTFTGDVTDDKSKVYIIPKTKIDEYMRLFFGPNVSYNPVGRMTYPFSFQINRKNVGSMTYNISTGGYETVFKSFQDINKKINVVDPVYGELSSAWRNIDGEIMLQEKVVYTSFETNNNRYTVKIFKEPARVTLLDTKSDLSINEARNLKISPSDYETTSIIQYTFGLDNSVCYFKESEIIA